MFSRNRVDRRISGTRLATIRVCPEDGAAVPRHPFLIRSRSPRCFGIMSRSEAMGAAGDPVDDLALPHPLDPRRRRDGRGVSRRRHAAATARRDQTPARATSSKDLARCGDSSRRRGPFPPSTIPNIVTIYEIGEADAGRFIVLEYVKGRTLRSLIGGPAGPAVDRAGRAANRQRARGRARAPASFTVTSSPKTSWSATTATRRCWTSVWPA